MRKFLARVLLPIVAGSPASPQDGELWYDVSLTRVRARQNGTTVSLGVGQVPIGGEIDYHGFEEPADGDWKFPNGQALSRTAYPDMHAISWIGGGGTATNGSNVITGMISSVTDMLAIGTAVEHAFFPAGTVITAITATTVTVNNNATAGGGISARFYPHGNGDGSTTFNLPDGRSRTRVQRDASNGVLAGRDGMGQKDGAQTVALTATQTPLRSHSHSGTTGSESATHTHTGTSGTESADHTHTGTSGNDNTDHGHSATTGTVSSDHSHNPDMIQNNNSRLINTTAGTSYRMGFNTGTNSGITANHTHSVSTGGRSAFHQHSTTTGGRSATHTHTTTTGNASVTHTHDFTTGTPSVAEADGAAHDNMQPSIRVNKLVRVR